MERIYEILVEYIPFLPIFAGLSLEEIAWDWGARMYLRLYQVIEDLGPSMYNVIASDSSGKDIFGNATFISQAMNALLNNVGGTVIPSLSGLGMAIGFTFWLMSFIEMVAEDRMSPEMFVKSFAKLAIAIGLCFYAPELFSAIREFGDGLASFISSAGILQGDTNVGADALGEFNALEVERVIRELKAANPDINFLIVGLSCMGLLLPTYIIALVLVGICYIIQCTRILELAVRASFLPVALGLIADDGWRGAGGRYLKKLIAICAQGAVLIMVGKITTYIIEFGIDSINNFEFFALFQSFALVIAIGIACISVMFKSIGLVNDVFGV